MIEDVWMALDMLPRFRWRWERKDQNGGHPLISKLAEQVLQVNLRDIDATKDPILQPELDWDTDVLGSMLGSPSLLSQSQTHVQQQKPSVMTHQQYQNGGLVGQTVYGPRPQSQSTTAMKSGGGLVSSSEKLAEVPHELFYPFFPENSIGPAGGTQFSGLPNENGGLKGDNNGDYTQLLAAAAAQINPGGSFGCQPSHESYMLEEIVPSNVSHMSGHPRTVWTNVVSSSWNLYHQR